MSIEFRMPSLGPDMAEGALVEWRVAPGARIRRGQVVALVETEKGIIDIEAFHDATVERLLVEPGAVVPVGVPLALLSDEAAANLPTSRDGAVPDVPTLPHAPAAVPEGAPATVPGLGGPPATAAQAIRHQLVSPAARVRAHALGVQLAAVSGTGPGGAVTIADVERSGSAPTKAPARSPMRHAIAASMTHAKREIPHYYLSATLDFSPVLSWLADFNRERAVEDRLMYAALLIRAVALAAREIPGFNGHFRDGGFLAAAEVHVGFAIAQRKGGLVAPALLGAHAKDLRTIMRELTDLVARARSGHLRSSELALSTITITSLGEEGVESVIPIIFPDQVAIVGIGSPLQRPWVVEGKVVPRPVLCLSLAADHRVSDGRSGARFLDRVRALLSAPGEL